MNKINITKDFIEIKMEGIDVLWALKRRLIIPRNLITSIYLKNKDVRPPKIKLPGSAIPRLILSGTYYGKNRKEFWSTHFKQGVVFELDNYKYTRVVIDVENPEDIINKFNVKDN